MNYLLFLVLLLAFLAVRNLYQVYRLSRRYSDALTAGAKAPGNADV